MPAYIHDPCTPSANLTPEFWPDHVSLLTGPYDPLPASFSPNHRISLVASDDTLLYILFFRPLTGATVFLHFTRPQADSTHLEY